MSTVVVTSADYPASGNNRTRSKSIQELLEYTGGDGRGNAERRAGLVWDAAVREFNTVAWQFNRVIDDILLDSTMLNNTTAATLGRDTGVAAGFTLSTGTTVDYWVEERVKSGNTITKRNINPEGIVVTLTGDATNDKPVVTRPTTVNVDTTHWALYASAAGGAFPNGAQIAEVAIATTTIEDTRTGNDPALSTGVLYNPHDYRLSSGWRDPIAAETIDSGGHRRWPVLYVPWHSWQTSLYDGSLGGNSPQYYTVRNLHETGNVSYWPRPAGGQQYPTVRHHYHRRIDTQAGPSGVLNVPMEVDEAIFQLALSKLMLMTKGREFARDHFGLASGIRRDVEWQWRDYSEEGK